MKFLTLKSFEDRNENFHKKTIKALPVSVSYTNVELLKNFITKFGKIKPRYKTNFKGKLQRLIAKAIKRGRNENLIPTNFSLTF